MHLSGGQSKRGQVYVCVDYFAWNHEVQYLLSRLKSASGTDVDHAAGLKFSQHQRDGAGGIGLAYPGECDHDFLPCMVRNMQCGVVVGGRAAFRKEGEQGVAFFWHGGKDGDRLAHGSSIAHVFAWGEGRSRRSMLGSGLDVCDNTPMCKWITIIPRSVQLWRGVLLLAVLPLVPAVADEPALTNSTPAMISSNPVDRVSLESTNKEVVYEDIAVLTEALMLVKRQYAEEKPLRDLIYGAIDGMLVSLDPHSGFLQPQQYQDLQEDTSGHFSGIGIHVGIKDGRVLVLAPIDGSPAQRAGLMSGDKLIKINGVSALGISMDETVRRLRGAKGSPVSLTVEREGRDPFDVTLLRDDIKVSSVKGVRIVRDGVGYIRLTQFGEGSGPDFRKALLDLQEKKMTSLVVDLRDNPGGLLNTAVEIVGLLLPKGAEIVSVRGRDGTRSEEHHLADGPMHLSELPLALLVNGHSASAAEIMAGAMQDHHRAILVGETTFGKASVQNIMRLATRPECAVRLTTAHYYTPAGRMIHGKGIQPDIQVPVPLSTWRKVLLKRAYDEMPEAFPVASREKVEDVSDEALNRAVDMVIGARILKGAN